jgi:ABC-2 type transport system permease protein
MKMLEAKYLALIKISFKRMNEFKFDFIMRYLEVPLYLTFIYFLWKLIFKFSGKTELGGMEFSLFFIYMALARFIFISFPFTETSDEIEEIIKSGKLTAIITRPVTFQKYIFFKLNFNTLVDGLLGIVLFLLMSYVMGWYILDEPVYWVLFTASFILAICLNYFFYFTIGLLSFWADEIYGITQAVRSIRMFFSGELIPVTMFPGTLLTITSFLPFKYMLFNPVYLYLKKYPIPEAINQLGLQLVWTIIFLILSKITYQKGLAWYNSYGG